MRARSGACTNSSDASGVKAAFFVGSFAMRVARRAARMLPPDVAERVSTLGEHSQLVQAAKGAEVEEERTETASRQAQGEAPGMLREKVGPRESRADWVAESALISTLISMV